MMRRQSLRRRRGGKGVLSLRRLHRSHQGQNPRRSKGGGAESSSEPSQEEKVSAKKKPHPARRWVVERTISWLTKRRRSLRTRWEKKAENWLALVQLACAHILLNLAVFG
jgi:hypothetical protein